MSKIELNQWQDPEDGFPVDEYFDAVIVALEEAGVGVFDSCRIEAHEFVIALDPEVADRAAWWQAKEFHLVWRVNEESDPLRRGEDETFHGWHGVEGPPGWYWIPRKDEQPLMVCALDHPVRRNTSMGPLAEPEDVAAAVAALVKPAEQED